MCDLGGEDVSVPYAPQGADYQKMLQAYGAGMPELQSIERQYQPGFTGLDLSSISDELTGVNGAPGYLSLYQNQVAPAINAVNAGAEAANVGTVANLGPAAASAVRGLNPGQSALMDSLTKTATDQMNLGTQLDPNTTSSITNAVRSNWASRGLGTSGPAQLSEAMQLYGGGQSLLGQREGEAGNVASLSGSLYSNPALNLVTNPGGTPSQAQTLTATGAGATGSQAMITPGSTMDIYDEVFNANNAATIASANNTAAEEGAQFGAMAKMGSSL